MSILTATKQPKLDFQLDINKSGGEAACCGEMLPVLVPFKHDAGKEERVSIRQGHPGRVLLQEGK